LPRLFAALEIPHQAQAALLALRGGLRCARWVEPADYHITLRFYGDVDNQTADALVSALDKVTAAPFALRLSGFGVFTANKPRSLYASLAESAPLLALQAKIEHYSRLAVPAETRSFTPHITLARLKPGLMAAKPAGRGRGRARAEAAAAKEAAALMEEELAGWLAAHGAAISAEFAVARFCLMSSKDSVGGGPYLIEESWPLAGKQKA